MNLRSCIFFAFLLLVASSASAQDSSSQALLRQIAGVLDYLASDYAGAVDANGQVTHDGEYAEQLELVQEARALALRAGLAESGAEASALARIGERMRAKSSPTEVATLCRQARAELLSTHRITLAPRTQAKRERGAELYRTATCSGCHGELGGGDGAAGATLTPKPANFLDASRMVDVSPARAFHAITYGIGGTGMVGFGQLSESDRWNLAYYILAMRHDGTSAEAGRRIVEGLAQTEFDATSLADESARTLGEKPAIARLTPSERDAVIAYAQRVAPFAAGSSATFDVARERLRDGLEAYEHGRDDEARRLFISAYLDGVEPNEATLSANDPALMRQIETAMLGVREAAAHRAQMTALRTKVDGAIGLLDRAESAQASGSGTLLGAAAIALREGFEAALLIAALLGLVRKKGSIAHEKIVHLGWAAAIPTGALTWLAVGHLIGGLERELAEGIIALLAAFVLLGVTHWVLGQVSSKHFFGFLFKRANESIAQGTRGAAIAVFSLSFIAAYREAFEVVLFYRAMLLQAGNRESLVWIGAAAGLGVLVVIVFVLRALGQKLDPKRFMLVSSVLLAGLSLVMVGKGIHALQEAGVVGITNVLPSLNVSGLGLHGTVQVMAAQTVLLLLLCASAFVPQKKS